MAEPVDPDEFPAGRLARLHPEPARRRRFRGRIHPDLLPQFTQRGWVVLLAGVHVPGTGRGPEPRRDVLEGGPPLQQNPPGRVEDHHVYGPMPEPAGVHFTPRRPADHGVARVDHIKKLLGYAHPAN